MAHSAKILVHCLGPEEVGHDHVHTKRGVLPHMYHCTKCKSLSKALKTVLNIEIHEKQAFLAKFTQIMCHKKPYNAALWICKQGM